MNTVSDQADAARIAGKPGVQRFPSRDVELLFMKDFLGADECAGLVQRIDAKRRPSTIVGDGDATFRTSETCDLDMTDPLVKLVNERICRWTGIDIAYGETLQGQRYQVGQEFKAHTDFFEPYGPDYDKHCARAGNRTWTVMIYLNEPGAGGGTRFTRIDKLVKPETGKLVAWNNRTPEGHLNEATMHHGMKVRQGTKYIITKWFRERPWR